MDEATAKALLGGAASQSDTGLAAGFASPPTKPEEAPGAPMAGISPMGMDLGKVAEVSARQQLKERTDFVRRNFIGTPIDLEEEAGPQLKFMVAFQPTDEDRLTFLNKHLREQNPEFYSGADMPARKADNGEILIRVPDESGKPKEIPLNKEGFTASDLATVAAHVPQTAAALAAAFATKRLPLGVKFPKTMTSLYSTGAGAAEAAAQDLITRGVTGMDVQPGEILARRGVEIPVGLAWDAATLGALKIGSTLLSPFAGWKPGVIQQDLAEGMAHFKKEFGYDFPATIGEMTGSPLLLRTEASMAKLPGSAAEATTGQQAKRAFFEKTQESMMELKPGETRAVIPSEETIGQKAVQAIRSKLEPIQTAIKTGFENVTDLLSRRLNDLMDKVTGSAQQVFQERVGAGVRAKALAMFESLQQQAAKRYGALYDLPGGTERLLSAPNAAKEAKDLLKSLPGYQKTITKPAEGGLVTPSGSPATVTKTVAERFESVLPSKAISVMEELADTKGAKMSLQDLIGARTALDDVIAKERGGLPDVKLRELVGARSLFTKAIKEAAETSPDPRMAPMWKEINEWYAQEAKRFDPNAIQKLFIRADKPGHLLDEQIVTSLKPSEYLQFKEFLGPTSPEFSALKRSIVDEVLRSSRLPGGRIDPKAFQRDFLDFYRTRRAIFDDIFPKAASQQANLIGEGLATLKDAEAVDAKELSGLLTGADPEIRKRLSQIGMAQSKLNAKYRSDLLKQIGEGRLDPASFDAGKFVDTIYANASPTEVRSVLAELAGHPEAMQQLRQKVIERVFYDAQRAVKAVDPARLGTGEVLRPANASVLDRVLGDESNRRKLTMILGNKTMMDLRMMGKLLKAGEVTEQSFASAGGISGGMFVTGMIRSGPFGYLGEWAKQKFASIMLTSPVLQQYAANRLVQKIPLDEIAFGLIATQQFQETLVREFGSAGAREITQHFLRSTARYSEARNPQETPEQRQQRFEKLLGTPPQ